MAPPEARTEAQGSSEALQLEEHRPYLLRFALVQLRDRNAAEDAVQETLLAALQSSARFAGRSSVKTWLTGILKHKIVDHLRRQLRELPLERPEEADGDPDADVAEAVFAPDGGWRELPRQWHAPDRSFESSEFWKVFDACVQVMPQRSARVFVMRELLELSTEEICKELGISTTNCWVLLHRARLALRECLDTRWFKT